MSQSSQRRKQPEKAEGVNHLERGRNCYDQRAWADAYLALSRADQEEPLEAADDLELLATSAYLIGRDDDYLRALERAYQAHLDSDERLLAIRSAVWLSTRLVFRGEMGRATGWLRRAQRLLGPGDGDCAERGHLMLVEVNHYLAAGEIDAAYASAADAADIGERCGDAELVAIARHLQGRVLVLQGQIAKGLPLLDEAMLAVTTKEMSPIASGLIYCSLIETCHEAYALSRAREWTFALQKWCEGQRQLVAFTGLCHVHRAEILRLSGSWPEAIKEARRACERCLQADNQRAAAAALYQQAELHRLRGEFTQAWETYRKAGEGGRDPQPGLALLRLAQGQTNTAAAAIRSAMSGTAGRLQRTQLLPACVEIMIAAGDLATADNASRELERIAQEVEADLLDATASQAQGAIELARGNAHEALGHLRRALELWQRIEDPYAEARAHELIGMACRVLNDEDGTDLALAAARAVFAQLGAAPDLARIGSLTRSADFHRLTARELQVLRLVATGSTNRAIAAELCLSERTVDRHVSNIFDKLDVTSRAAATALAYERKLI
jgi:DNA-binding CsgD family transcriptional regulator